LKTGRGLLLERTVGRYYVIDIRRNCVTQQYVDVEDLARELKVLQSWEELRAESGVVGAEKYREATSDRMLWDDATLSRHFEIEWNCEIRPATADGGEVWGPRGSNAWG
jgi:hypothetical protein